MDYQKIQHKTTAVIAAISKTRGVELFNMHYHSVNIPKFLVFLDDLRRARWADDIALFVDRLSVHRSKVVAARLDELGIPLVLNASYEPDFNPIENIFSEVKRNYKKIRLENIVKERTENVTTSITSAFNSIPRLHCIRCIHRAERCLNTKVKGLTNKNFVVKINNKLNFLIGH